MDTRYTGVRGILTPEAQARNGLTALPHSSSSCWMVRTVATILPCTSPIFFLKRKSLTKASIAESNKSATWRQAVTYIERRDTSARGRGNLWSGTGRHAVRRGGRWFGASACAPLRVPPPIASIDPAPSMLFEQVGRDASCAATRVSMVCCAFVNFANKSLFVASYSRQRCASGSHGRCGLKSSDRARARRFGADAINAFKHRCSSDRPAETVNRC